MKLELIENAGAAWRFWSVRLSAGIVAVAAAEPYLPTLKAVLPPGVVRLCGRRCDGGAAV